MAGQKFPEIGLRAVFEITGFQTGYRKYQTMMGDIDRTTKQTAQRVNQATKGIADDVVRTFSEFSRRSSIVQDAFDNLSPEASLAEMQRMGEAFRELGSKAQVNVGVFDHLVNSGLDFSQAMQVAGGQIAFNVDAFDRLINRGVDANQAFEQVASGAADAGSSITFLGRSFTGTAIAIGAATAALKISISFVRQAIDSYLELSEATRQVSLQTGLLTREASGWVNVAKASGISTATSERAMTAFLSKVADMRREQRMGEDSTSDFSRAMLTLGISVTSADGSLKSTSQLLNEVNEAFRQLGPGVVSAQLAADLFGYSGRFLLPILTDQEQSLSDLQTRFDDLGATLSTLDKTNYAEFRKANIDLKASIQGLYNDIARQFVPVLTDLSEWLTKVIAKQHEYNQAVREGEKRYALGRGFSALEEARARGDQETVARLERILGIQNKVAEEEERLAQERANAAQDAAAAVGDAEAKIREEREKTMRQLEELKTKLVQKLADIDADAAQGWQDILINRQRDALDRALQLAWRLDDLRTAYNERLDAIEADFAKRWEDILVNRQRQAIERGYRLAWQYEDLARDTEKRRNDAIRDAAEKEKEIRKDSQKRIIDAEKDAQEKREKLEQEHRKRLRDIQQKYFDTVTEAARQNDAVAVARAMRERARSIRDEEQRYTDEQRELTDSLTKKRQEIDTDRREREEDQQQELARTLQRIEENYQEQLRQIDIQQRREMALRERQYQWEREDFEKAKAEQIQAAKDAYDKQIAELEKQQAREAVLRKIQYERQEIDFVKNWQRRINEARTWYERERDELAQHLNMTGEMLEAAYQDWINGAAKAVRMVTDALSSEVARYQQYLSDVERQRIRYQYPGSQVAAPPKVASAPRVPGQPVFGFGPGMAAGGVVQATRPTSVLMGEAGPETAVFMPGRAGSMNVNHNFGRLGVDFGGLPSGMNTQQVQAIVYQVMIQLAKGIQIPR